MNNYCTVPMDRSFHLFLQISTSITLSVAIFLDVNVLLPILNLPAESCLHTGGIDKFVEVAYHLH